MKRTLLIGLVFAAVALPGLLKAQVETSVGKLSVGGKIKWMWMYQAQDDDAVGSSGTFGGTQAGQRWFFDGSGVDQFTTSNVEIDVKGAVGENVSYIIELQASFFPGGQSAIIGGLGGMKGMSSFNEIQGSRLGVRQAKIVIADLIPMTTVTLGTFNLPLGTYQTRATNDYGLILLPLMNMAVFGNAWQGAGPGALYAPVGLGWQATGVDICVKPADIVALHLAYFNGTTNQSIFGGGLFGAAGTNGDMDLEKSWLIKLEVMPTEGAQIGVAYLSEGWQEDVNGRAAVRHTGNEQKHAHGWVVNAGYKADKLDISMDWMTMVASGYSHGKGGYNHYTDLNWMAWQITAGIWVTDQIEVLARYDWADPDTSNNKRKVGAAPGTFSYLPTNDALTIWTLGVNYRVSENAELALNYLWIKEQGLPINENDFQRGKVKYGAGNNQGRRQQLNNDTFLLQVQVWQ
jgi:hypothetical protein